MPLNLVLHLQTSASWRSVAEAILESEWSEANAEEWPQTQPWGQGRIWVGSDRPMHWDPILTDLGVDYDVVVTFILNKAQSIYDQVGSALSAAARVWSRFDGRGALLYERDVVILRWDENRFVVNQSSSFKDQAVQVLGPAVALEPIPWE